MFYILLFFLGASIGSFLNVVISRSIDGEQWRSGRSVCDHCGQTLSWYDLIPLVSYLVYRGRSRCCHKPLSLQHPVVESMMGLLFLWWAVVGVFFFRLVTHPLTSIQPVYWLFIGIILMIITIIDLFYGLIPTLLVYGGLALTAVYRLILLSQGAYHLPDFLSAIMSAVGATAFFWFLRFITRNKGMGDGDVVLASLVGFILGWPKVTIGVLAGFVIGALVATVMVVIGTKKMRATIPFGPFMVAGVFVALIYGERLWHLIVGG